MIKKGNPGDGFLLCFLVNLLFNFWWGTIAVILFALYLFLGIPLFWSLIALFIWLCVAFISTALVVWATSSPDDNTPARENLNPYSAKNSDVLGKQEVSEAIADAAQEEHSDKESISPPAVEQEIKEDAGDINNIKNLEE